MDESLQSYARAHLLRANPSTDHRDIEAYVTSSEFKAFATIFEQNLSRQLDRFMKGDRAVAPPDSRDPAVASQRPASAASMLRPFTLADLSMQIPKAPHQPTESITAPTTPVQLAPFAGAIAPVEPAQAPHAAASAPSIVDGLASMAPNPSLSGLVTRPALPSTAPALISAPLPELATPPATQGALPQPDLGDIAFRLPNARAGEAYAHRLEAIDSTEAVVFDQLIVPEGLSMSADLQTGAVSGTPTAAGDFTLTVIYHFARQSASRRRRALVHVAVTPDPRTMWKNLPSDSNDPYWKGDEECSSVRGPELSIIAASKRGRSHAHVGSFRDDDYRIEHLPESGWYVAVVADGAGSAKYSRRGAALICEEAQKHVRASLTGEVVELIDTAAHSYAGASDASLTSDQREVSRQGLHALLSSVVGNAAYYAAKAIVDEMSSRSDLGGVFKDYSSTALITVCKRYSFGTLCAAYWVGDGAVGVYSKRDGITLLGEVDSGEFSGQTRFLDNAAVEHEMLRKRTRFTIVDDMTALFVMTDGVSDAKFETEAMLKRDADWHAFWTDLDRTLVFANREAGKEEKLLGWLDFWSQGNHDDRTIAIIS
jgi:hypothetical protein